MTPRQAETELIRAMLAALVDWQCDKDAQAMRRDGVDEAQVSAVMRQFREDLEAMQTAKLTEIVAWLADGTAAKAPRGIQ